MNDELPGSMAFHYSKIPTFPYQLYHLMNSGFYLLGH